MTAFYKYIMLPRILLSSERLVITMTIVKIIIIDYHKHGDNNIDVTAQDIKYQSFNVLGNQHIIIQCTVS